MKKFKFDTKVFNSYDLDGLCKEHCMRVYYPWIHGACHWLEEDPWRYFCNSSRLNEAVSMVLEWLATLKVAAPQGATTIATKRNKPTPDKGNRKIYESTEVEKSSKFKEDPLVERVALEIEEKR